MSSWAATVIDLVDHPEFHRIIVQAPDKTELTVEVVATDAALGACTHHGFAIQPRWEPSTARSDRREPAAGSTELWHAWRPSPS